MVREAFTLSSDEINDDTLQGFGVYHASSAS